MPIFPGSVQGSLSSERLLSWFPQLFCTPTLAAKLRAPGKGKHITLSYGDMFVGSYSQLSDLRDLLQDDFPGIGSATQIHHITENQHLGFIAKRGAISAHSYDNDEPCVLLAREHHTLLMENIIGKAEQMERERRRVNPGYGIDYFQRYEEYRAKNPVPDNKQIPERSRKAYHRAEWVATCEAGTRRKIADMLRQIYEVAYQDRREGLLRQIALDTIETLTI